MIDYLKIIINYNNFKYFLKTFLLKSTYLLI